MGHVAHRDSHPRLANAAPQAPVVTVSSLMCGSPLARSQSQGQGRGLRGLPGAPQEVSGSAGAREGWGLGGPPRVWPAGPTVGAAPQEEEWLTGHAFQVPARPSKPGGPACGAHPRRPLPVPRFVFSLFHLAGSPIFTRWEGTVQRAEGPVRGHRPQPGGSGSPPHRHSCQQASTGPFLCKEGPWRTRTNLAEAPGSPSDSGTRDKKKATGPTISMGRVFIERKQASPGGPGPKHLPEGRRQSQLGSVLPG